MIFFFPVDLDHGVRLNRLMILEKLLGPMPTEQFLKSYLGQKPYTGKSRAEMFKGLYRIENEDLHRIEEDFHELLPGYVEAHWQIDEQGSEEPTWHFEAEDTFLIQSVGEKYFYLKPDVYSKSVTQLRLKAGDWLYIPAGYLHRARALSNSAELQVGVIV